MVRKINLIKNTNTKNWQKTLTKIQDFDQSSKIKKICYQLVAISKQLEQKKIKRHAGSIFLVIGVD